MDYNVENKISFEELSPSLQNLLKSAAERSEIVALNNRTDRLVELLSGVRFDIVDKLEDVTLPINGKSMVIAGKDTNYGLYFYYNDRWNKIPTAAIDLNQLYTMTVVQSPHQTITVKYNNALYTGSFKAKINSDIEVSLIAEQGYIGGELSCPSLFSVIEDVTIKASDARLIPNYSITVIPKSHQTININCMGVIYTNLSIQDIPASTNFSIDTESDYGWNKGNLIITGDYIHLYENNYIISGDLTVTLEESTRKKYTVSIPAVINQKITFTYIDSETGETHTETITSLYRTISVPFESEFTATIDGINGYLPGELSITSGIITSDIIITATQAKKTYNKEVFNIPGEYTWTAPNNITKVKLVLMGAGGGCHSEVIEEETQTIGYINGGNGERIETLIPVVVGREYPLIVGNRGISFESSGESSSAFNINANGGSLDGTDAGDGNGGKGDTVNYNTGEIIRIADDGYITIEYGTDIEQEEVNP